MAHPTMFDDDDPFLGRVRAIAGTFPGAAEKVSHGRPAFFTTKVFAYYGGSIRIDGTWVQHPRSLVVLVDPDEREALLQDERVYVPAYLGPSGWIGIDLEALDPDGPDGPDETDWDEVRELLDASFRLTARKRHIAELDARG